MAKRNLLSFMWKNILSFTLDELSSALNVSPDFILQMVEYGAIEPRGFAMEDWQFDEEIYDAFELLPICNMI